ncbi:hypothetical protein CPB86DRAFT_738689 [Serendipita vermifera]|nr:hypothetical protein CPB86DRAFT_738689 [Serendipita vermifera]
MAKKKSKSSANPDVIPKDVETAPPPPKPQVDPKWVWPPFPTPPEGAMIIPFTQFEPKGIVISVDDESERDGEGLRTVRLQVKHNVGGSRGKSKKKKDPLAEISQEELSKMTWDKRWELGESMRTAEPLDLKEPLVEQFPASTRLFHQGRRWDHSRQELWDQFRLYTGVITGVKAPPKGKKRVIYEEDDNRPGAEEPGIESDISDEDLMAPVEGANKTEEQEEEAPEEEPDSLEEAAIKQVNEERYQRLLSLAEERPLFWISDPEKATKIFLSSHFRDRGLMWSEPNTRDMPLLVCFYLSFVLRNKLFSDKVLMKGYEKALVIAQRASVELLFTFRTSRALPEEWGRACAGLWGLKYQTSFDTWYPSAAPARLAEVDEDPIDPADQAKLVAAEYDFGQKKPIHEIGAREQDPYEEDDAVAQEATIEEVVDDEPSAEMTQPIEAAPAEEYDTEGWGSPLELNTRADLVQGWMANNDSSGGGDGWGNYVQPSMFPFLGPTTIPISQIAIRAEKSTRMLKEVIPPDPSSSNALSQLLTTLVLSAWPDPEDDPDSLVTSPRMIDFGEGDQVVQLSRQHAPPFDRTKDDIRVYVDPKVTEECRAGMGIGGVWVQVGNRIDEEAVQKGLDEMKKSEPWWYMERLEFVIPGYWTTNEAHRDMTRIENDPEYAYEYLSR